MRCIAKYKLVSHGASHGHHVVHHTEGTAAHLDRLDEHGAFKHVAVDDQVGKPGCRRRKITSVGMFTVALLPLWENLSGAGALSVLFPSAQSNPKPNTGPSEVCAVRSAELCMARPTCVPRHYTQRAPRRHYQHAGEQAGAPRVLSLDYLASYLLCDLLAVVAVGT